MGFFNKKSTTEESTETQELKRLLEEARVNAKNLRKSLENIDTHMHGVSDHAGEIGSIMQEYGTSISQMNENISEIANVMEEMENSFEGMNEEAKDGARYAQNSNKAAYDIMMESENERREVEERANAVEKALMDKIEQSKEAEKILDLTANILEIADQTNLLSLNASIEAARAGETGKGFAVVAEEIGKLANQSNEASTEISELVNLLSYNSSQTMDIMDSVQDAMNDQTKKLVETANIFKQLQEHVSHVADGVDVIRDATVQLGKETDEIGKDIKNLSDIAQRNEDTVKGTISFSDEVLGTVNSVTEMSTEVSSSANDMAGVVSHFRM